MFKTFSRASSFLLSRNTLIFGRTERSLHLNTITNFCVTHSLLRSATMAEGGELPSTSNGSGVGVSGGGGSSGSSTTDPPQFSNHLLFEKSPYLLQHAHNPVEWYPWGDEAIQRAKSENKLIFLSIGYSTCHWCHVMEHESFENEEIAQLMNDNYINIKVDREERPDIDKIYMNFVMMVNGSGGWPMSVWLTPDLAPISAGTYFPPRDRWGVPGFITVLTIIADKWKKNSADMIQTGNRVIKMIEKNLSEKEPNNLLIPDTAEAKLDLAIRIFKRSFDEEYGGLGNHPKFPEVSRLNLLFHAYFVTKDPLVLKIVLKTLEKIGNGGIHDHVFGGFARYSVDKQWHVPHFEKMLYDQGQLMAAYATAFKLTTNPFFLDIADGIFRYIMKDLRHPNGGFYSGEDADSLPTFNDTRKIEGAFYAWTWSEIKNEIEKNSDKFNVNADEVFTIFCHHYDIKENGNVAASSDPHNHLSAKNIFIVRNSLKDTSLSFGKPIKEIQHILRQVNQILHEVREKRPRPHLDTKIITSWNGLILSGLSKLANCCNENRQEYLDAAQALYMFLKKFSFDHKSDKLLRSCYGTGSGSELAEPSVEPISGFLDDYAFLIRGLLEYYKATLDISALKWAKELQDIQDNLFWDNVHGGYYYSEANSRNVVVRLKEDHDGAEPCGNSVSARNLLLISTYFDENEYNERADKLFAYFNDSNPFGYALPEMMSALLLSKNGFDFSAIVGPKNNTTEQFLNIIRKYYIPGLVLVHFEPEIESIIKPKSQNKFKMSKDKPTVYFCHNKVCQLPITEPQKLQDDFNTNFLAIQNIE